MELTSAGGSQTDSFGYYLVDLGSRGAGVIRVRGAGQSTNQSQYLGATPKDAEQNLGLAADKLGAFGINEANPSQLISQATTKGIAWEGHTPSDVGSDFDLYALATAPLGGEVAGFVGDVFDAAGIADPFGSDSPSSSIPRDSTSDDTADPAGERGARGRDDGSGGKDDDNQDGDNDPKRSALTSVGGAMTFLTDPKTWLRFLEMIGGALLIAMGLKSLAGSPTTNPVELIPSSARFAAAAAMA